MKQIFNKKGAENCKKRKNGKAMEEKIYYDT